VIKISPGLYVERDFEGLLRFLTDCRDSALRDNHYKVASISLEVKHLDSLAVLESIYESDELHFYMEHPIKEEAIAGADAILEKTFHGPGRFQQVLQFSNEILNHTFAVGDLHVPFWGPHFFTAFTFYDKSGKDTSFSPATVFLPRWQVGRKEGIYGAVANIVVYPTSDPVELAERTWAAHKKFAAFDYSSVESAPKLAQKKEHKIRELGGDGAFLHSVKQACQGIALGRYEKIVIAKCIELIGPNELKPLVSLNSLRNKYPGCYAFSFSGGSEKSFIGATPERLVRVEGDFVYTEALAGSISRGATAAVDASFAQALLESAKNVDEHRFVVDFIKDCLESIGMEVEFSAKPNLLQLPNVQHLRTPIKARKPEGLHLLDTVKVLHPTPAVGGVPQEPALADIRRIEPFSRGLYAGTLGWFDHGGNGEMVVAIRSALIEGNTARAYAGNGILVNSSPEEEGIEVDLKLQALLQALH
tara:strand:+ start:11174 stop:12598 length:1425 start_codon:yes stop_codon:yes gene_type:complete